MSSPGPSGRLIGASKPAAEGPAETPPGSGEAPGSGEGPDDAPQGADSEGEDSEVFFAGSGSAPGQPTIGLDELAASEQPTGLDPSPPGKPRPVEIPKQLGSYRIVGELARGGMGVVLRGHHEVLERDVAIKLLLPTAKGDKECFERFLLEAQATARLRHPGIVAIHDVARDPRGTPYLVMDFIEGQTLRQRIQERGALGPKEVAEIMAVVSEAVAHAHEQGILHRDLKPDNVIVDAAGAPHLTDFGLAKLVEPEEPGDPSGPSGRLLGGSKLRLGLTNKGAVMGTPRYMAPEQVRGRRLAVTADVWALGVMLYEALTGKPPFPGTTVIEIFEGIVTKEPTPPTQLNPLIPARIERICLRCLSKDPAARPQSASEVAAELRRTLETAQRPLRTSAPPPTLVDGTRVTRVLKAGTLVLVVVGVPLVFGPLRSAWLGVPTQPSAAATLSPSLAPGKVVSLEASAEAGDPAAMLRWGEHLLASGRPDEGLEFLERAAEAGQGRACLVLGQAYQRGQGVEVDEEEALAWYRLGTEAGEGYCSVAAGLLLSAREDPSELSEARELLEASLAAVKTDRAASGACLTALGRLYIRVDPRDAARGVEYLERAAGLGATAAMVDLARLLEQGELLRRDYAAALAWLERAGAGQDPIAWIELGDVYAAGRLGLEPDPARARQAYERARAKRPGLVEARLENLRGE